jgi:hypothetical protein
MKEKKNLRSPMIKGLPKVRERNTSWKRSHRIPKLVSFD